MDFIMLLAKNMLFYDLQLWWTLNLHPMVASYWKIHLKIFFINYLYIFTLTLPSHLVFEGVVYFELTVSTAKLLSSIRLIIWYTYWSWSRGCLQLHRQQFRWWWYQTKLTSDSDSGAPTTPGTIEKGKKFDYK